MIDTFLRVSAAFVWAAAFIAFLPGAIRAFRAKAQPFDAFCMAACFACANRVTFSLTNLFAPELTVLSQVMGLAAAVWLAVVAFKVVPRG